MWDFLREALAEGGMVGLMWAAAIVGFGFVARTLWRTNQELHAKLLDAQEKRVADAKEVSDLLVQNARELEETAGKLARSMEALVQIQRGGMR